MDRERPIKCALPGGFKACSLQQAPVLRQRASTFVDDGANYENGNHNVTKMEAIQAGAICASRFHPLLQLQPSVLTAEGVFGSYSCNSALVVVQPEKKQQGISINSKIKRCVLRDWCFISWWDYTCYKRASLDYTAGCSFLTWQGYPPALCSDPLWTVMKDKKGLDRSILSSKSILYPPSRLGLSCVRISDTMLNEGMHFFFLQSVIAKGDQVGYRDQNMLLDMTEPLFLRGSELRQYKVALTHSYIYIFAI